MRLLLILVASAAFIIGSYTIGDGLVRAKRLERSVEVRGLAERVVKSTEATWEVRFVASGDDLGQVNRLVATAQKEIEDFFEAASFSSSEIQRGALSLSDNSLTSSEYGARSPRFAARGVVYVVTPNVDLVQGASQRTDKLLERGVVIEGSSVRYTFNDLNLIKPPMLKEATESARESALSFASDSGAALGTIKAATQGLFTIQSPGQEYDDGSSIMKKVRVVTRVVYYLE